MGERAYLPPPVLPGAAMTQTAYETDRGLTRQRPVPTCGHPERGYYALDRCKPCYEAHNRRQHRERRERLERRLRELERTR